MSFPESLLVDAFGLAIVFAVLIIICFLIKLISIVVGGIQKKPAESAADQGQEQAASFPAVSQAQLSSELDLINVDEKTAALIMAIVSKNTNIPLSKLQFTSIKLVK
jgi:Na+-transporting methylmalonyl-CoA/oxaloacetate decarboxylase gamma subunit